jgi:uncharacterized membrane protein YwzB
MIWPRSLGLVFILCTVNHIVFVNVKYKESKTVTQEEFFKRDLTTLKQILILA